MNHVNSDVDQIFHNIDWESLIANLAGLSDQGFLLVGPDGRELTSAGTARLIGPQFSAHRVEPRIDRLEIPASIELTTCRTAQLVIPIVYGGRIIGRLYNGAYKTHAGLVPGDFDAELAELCRAHCLKEASIREQLAMIGEQPFEKLVQRCQSLERLLHRQILDRALDFAISALRRNIYDIDNETGELWPKVAAAVCRVVAVDKIELFTVSPQRDAVTRVHPDTDGRISPEVLEDLTNPLDTVAYNRESNETLLYCTFQDRLYVVLRLTPITEFNKQDLKRLETVAGVIGEALLARRQRRAEQAIRELESTDAKNHRQRLSVIVENLKDLLNADDGEVVLYDPNNPDFYKVVARSGQADRDMPSEITRKYGPVKRLEASGRVIVVHDASQDQDFLELKENVDEIYQGEKIRGYYREYLASVRSFVKLPLMIGRRVIGALCLHRYTAQPFNLGMVHVIEMVAERGFADAVWFLVSAELISRIDEMSSNLSQARLSDMVADLSAAEARDLLHQRLAEEAMGLSGAYRTVVCMLIDGEKLAIMGMAGKWREDLRESCDFHISDRSSVAWTIRNGTTYRLDDVRKQDIDYLEVAPSETLSSVTIPLRSSAQTLGALHIEWDEVDACDPALISGLERLAALYADAIQTYDVDSDLTALDRLLRDAEKTGDPDYQSIVKLIANMLGASSGAVFLRNLDTGVYDLVGHTREGTLDEQNDGYPSGEGLTGSVIKQGRCLRLKNLHDDDELDSISPGLRRAGKVLDGEQEQDKPLSWLGIPIMLSDKEVFGVIRFTKSAARRRFDERDQQPGSNRKLKSEHERQATARRFDARDEQIAMAAAIRIAQCLSQMSKGRRDDAKSALASTLLGPGTIQEFSREIFTALEKGIGHCGAHIRLLDYVDGKRGVEPVMMRVAISDRNWVIYDKLASLFLRKGESIAGVVWETNEVFQDLDVKSEASKSEAICDEQYRKVIGTLAVAPLSSENDGIVQGLLHVYRVFPRALTQADIEFIADIADIALPGLRAIQRLDDLNIELARSAGRFLVELLGRRDMESAEFDFELDLLKKLAFGLNATHGWLVLRDESNETCVAYDQDGQRITCGDIWFDRVGNRLNKHGFRSHFSLDEADDVVRRLVDQVVPSFVEDEMIQVYTLALRSNKTETVAYFCLVSQKPYLVSYQQLKQTVRTLKSLADLIVVAYEFRDTEISRPLALMGAKWSLLEHQTRKPLEILTRALEELRFEETGGARHTKLLQLLDDEAGNFKTILAQLTNLLFLVRPENSGFELSDTLREVQQRIERHATGTELVWDIASESAHVRGVNDFLAIAVESVVRNALKAVRHKGQEGRVEVKLSQAGQSAIITVDDNGCGMDEETRKNAFKPFFSRTGSTGLGLSGVYSIVRSHAGKTQIISKVNQGTQFMISLPVAINGGSDERQQAKVAVR